MGFIEKRNGKYRARYRDPLGRQRSKTFVRKALATLYAKRAAYHRAEVVIAAIALWLRDTQLGTLGACSHQILRRREGQERRV